MIFELRKSRDFGELVTDTFTFVKLTWKPLLKSFIYICGFFVVASIVTDLVFRARFTGLEGATQIGYRRPSIFTSEYFLLLFFSYFQFFIISLMTFCFMSLYHEKGQVAPTVEEVWSYFKFYFFRYFFSFLLLLLLQVAGFAFCLFPGIYLLPIINIMLAAIVLENGTLGYAFRRGFFLIRDNWWQTFGALFVMAVIVYMATGFASIPTLILTFAKGFTGSMKSLTWVLTAIFTIFQHLFSVVLVLPWILAGLSYFSLAEKKEATGLAARIGSLGMSGTKELPEEEY